MKQNVQNLIRANPCSSLTVLKGVVKVGQGEYGSVYKGCLNGECKRIVAIKSSSNSLNAEHNITNRMKNKGAVNVYGLEKCDTKNFMYSEYLDGMTFEKWITREKPSPASVKTAIKKLINILKAIQNSEPTFRHNDLHLGNVFIVNGEPKIIDFGLSSINGIPNPAINVNMELKNGYGIYRSNHPMYDIHFFLNSLQFAIQRYKLYRYSELLVFINRVFPKGYVGSSTDYVQHFRLRANKAHGNLPTMSNLLKDTYFSNRSVAVNILKNLASRPKTKVTISKPKSPSPKSSTKSAKASAVRRAASILAAQQKMKKTKPPLRRPALTRTVAKPLSK